jgi:hypothetical protein
MKAEFVISFIFKGQTGQDLTKGTNFSEFVLVLAEGMHRHYKTLFNADEIHVLQAEHSAS